MNVISITEADIRKAIKKNEVSKDWSEDKILYCIEFIRETDFDWEAIINSIIKDMGTKTILN